VGVMLAVFGENGVQSVFHYIPLHSSPAGQRYGICASDMSMTDKVSSTLVRLPLFFGLSEEQQNKIIDLTLAFWR